MKWDLVLLYLLLPHAFPSPPPFAPLSGAPYAYAPPPSLLHAFIFLGTLHRPLPAPYTEHAASLPPHTIFRTPHEQHYSPFLHYHWYLLYSSLSLATPVRFRSQPDRTPRSRGSSTRHGATVT
ncbi:hypothetical protein B0H11DRAFT_2216853 [Mycena galericulata]|nr:hypothetical protein B0H11DRAFT_2216853 [Mycena galericulata]